MRIDIRYQDEAFVNVSPLEIADELEGAPSDDAIREAVMASIDSAVIEQPWPSYRVDEADLTAMIKRIRKALEERE